MNLLNIQSGCNYKVLFFNSQISEQSRSKSFNQFDSSQKSLINTIPSQNTNKKRSKLATAIKLSIAIASMFITAYIIERKLDAREAEKIGVETQAGINRFMNNIKEDGIDAILKESII